MTELFVADFGYMLSSLDDPDGTALDPQNARASGTGLVDASDTTATVMTGTDTGPVIIEVLVTSQPPPVDLTGWEADGWDAVAELSLRSIDGCFTSVTTSVGPDGPLTVRVGEPGSYRLRIQAKGRDLAYESGFVLDHALETHRITIWPAPWQPVTALRIVDQVSEHFNATA